MMCGFDSKYKSMIFMLSMLIWRHVEFNFAIQMNRRKNAALEAYPLRYHYLDEANKDCNPLFQW